TRGARGGRGSEHRRGGRRGDRSFRSVRRRSRARGERIATRAPRARRRADRFGARGAFAGGARSLRSRFLKPASYTRAAMGSRKKRGVAAPPTKRATAATLGESEIVVSDA